MADPEQQLFNEEVRVLKESWKVRPGSCFARVRWHRSVRFGGCQSTSVPLLHPSSVPTSSKHTADRPCCPSWQSPRFDGITRPYTAEAVVSKRGTLPISYPSNVQGQKLFKILSEHFKNGTPSHTYGA